MACGGVIEILALCARAAVLNLRRPAKQVYNLRSLCAQEPRTSFLRSPDRGVSHHPSGRQGLEGFRFSGWDETIRLMHASGCMRLGACGLVHANRTPCRRRSSG